jgi:hypothetical protein
MPRAFELTGARAEALQAAAPDFASLLLTEFGDAMRQAGYEVVGTGVEPAELAVTSAVVSVDRFAVTVGTGEYAHLTARVVLNGPDGQMVTLDAKSQPEGVRYYPPVAEARERLVKSLVNALSAAGGLPARTADTPAPLPLLPEPLVATPEASLDGQAGFGSAARPGCDGLVITLAADADLVKVGTELSLSVRFANAGSAPLWLRERTAFAGSELAIKDPLGVAVPAEAGLTGRAPEPGVFVGRAVLLAPGAERTVEVRLFLDERYRLLAAEDPQAPLGVESNEQKQALGVATDFPSKYIGAGRTFAVGRPGKVTLAYAYAVTEADRGDRLAAARTPDEAATDRLWLGRCVSDALQVTLR